MNCIFLGHRDTPDIVRGKLRSTIKALSDSGVSHFYVGNNGNFDFLAQVILCELSKKTSKIKYSIVLSRIDELAISGNQEATIFPEGLEMALPRFAISKRNEWLIKNASIVVTHMTSSCSNCNKWIEKARKKGATVINIAEGI